MSRLFLISAVLTTVSALTNQHENKAGYSPVLLGSTHQLERTAAALLQESQPSVAIDINTGDKPHSVQADELKPKAEALYVAAEKLKMEAKWRKILQEGSAREEDTVDLDNWSGRRARAIATSEDSTFLLGISIVVTAIFAALHVFPRWLAHAEKDQFIIGLGGLSVSDTDVSYTGSESSSDTNMDLKKRMRQFEERLEAHKRTLEKEEGTGSKSSTQEPDLSECKPKQV